MEKRVESYVIVRIDEEGNELISNGVDGCPDDVWLVLNNEYVTVLQSGSIESLFNIKLLPGSQPVRFKI